MSPYQRYLNAILLDYQRQFGSKLTPNGWVVENKTDPLLADKEYSTAAIREMQIAFHEALNSTDPLPDEMRKFLAIGFENLCSGHEFQLFEPYKRRGRPTSPYGEALKAYALNYKQLVDAHIIEDQNPIETIALAYGVNIKTVKNWIQRSNTNTKEIIRPPATKDRALKLLKQFGIKYKKHFNIK